MLGGSGDEGEWGEVRGSGEISARSQSYVTRRSFNYVLFHIQRVKPDSELMLENVNRLY